MKRKLFTLLFAILASLGTMLAAVVQIGDLYYILDETKTAKVTYELHDDANNYKGLTTVNIPASITYNGTTYSVTGINYRAFHKCTGLKSVTIPKSVAIIGNEAFSRCYALTSVEIPNSVTSIKDHAFYNCTDLTSVTMESTTPPTIGSWVFDYAYKVAVYVPYGTMQAYKSAWGSEYASIIKYAPLPYSMTINATNGTVSYTYNIGDTIKLSVTPNYGYHFTQWSDGNTDNPRTIELTQDTTFTAEFAIDKYGTCGDDNALTWTFDDKGVLTISGNGTLNSNYTFGLEAPESMQKVVIESGVSSVGNSAFKNQTTLKEIAISHGVNTIADEAFAGCTEVKLLTLGANLLSIGDNAFNGCKRIDEITVYAERVIDITETTFANIGKKEYVYVNVPEGSLRGYQRDDYWSEFDLRVIGATTTTVADDEVNVEPTSNTADVTWPAVENAATYELTIKDKDGNTICTLIFNAQGQLISIAFAAPGRGQSAGQIAGFTFTVTGLDSGSNYGFTMEAKNSQGDVLDTKEGTFTTTGGIATAAENASVDTKPTKVIRHGQLFILRDGKTYTVTGVKVE